MPADGSNAPANIPAAQVRPAVQVLAGPASTALVFNARTEAGRAATARFFGGLCSSDVETARNNRMLAKQDAMVREAVEAGRTGGERAAHAVLMAAVCREMGVA